MKKRELKFPKFATEQEEAEFWSTHSTTPYWEDAEEVPPEEIVIDPDLRSRILQRAREKQLISLRLEKRQIEQAKRIAVKKAIPYQVLIRSWIEEGIQNELQGLTIAQAPYQTHAGTSIVLSTGQLSTWRLPVTDFSVNSPSKESEGLYERLSVS